jgi:RNA-directed DNA polymerase
VDEAKPFKIPKREAWEAFRRVKANQGAAGVDGLSIAEFEANLSGNLYKLWNRLSSGSYFPPPVRRVNIPKVNGGTRSLGVPTVADRIAQEVARRSGADRGAGVSFRFLRLPTRQICDRGRARGS